jgi:hypothetical protein
MKEVYGIVSCDVVESTSLEMDALIQLRRDIHSSLFPVVETRFPEFWGRVVRGDTIECVVEQPHDVFRVALLIKCWLKDWAAYHQASAEMIESGIRYSIGIGLMRAVDKKEDFLDGEAIYLAGRNLDFISERGIPVAFGMRTADEALNALITNNLMLLEDTFIRLTEKQCIVVFHKLLGLTEMEIARELGITQTAVNLRARNAGWSRVKDTLDILEHIDYEWYVE